MLTGFSRTPLNVYSESVSMTIDGVAVGKSVGAFADPDARKSFNTRFLASRSLAVSFQNARRIRFTRRIRFN